MKLTTTKIIVAGLLTSAVGSAAMANEATIINGSQSDKPLELEYRIAYRNPGQPTVYGSTQMLSVVNSATIPFDSGAYKQAGIMPISVNGKPLPPSVTEFGAPQQCSLVTDNSHPTGIMKLIPAQHKISCEIHGGILD